MRVLHVTSMYPPNSNGGYELILESAVRHMRDAGHQAQVLTTEMNVTGEWAAEGSQPGVHRDLLSYWRPFHMPDYSWPSAFRLETHNRAALRRHVAEFAPTVVAWWAMGGMPFSMMETVRRAGIPAVSFVHDHWAPDGPESDPWLRRFRGDAGARRLGRGLARLAGIPTAVDLAATGDLVFVCDFLRRRAVELGVPAARAKVLPAGIEQTFLRPVAPLPWRWRLSFIGRLDARKGLHTAIRALALLPQEATLRIVGSGGDPDYVDGLKKLAADLGLSARVTFEGAVERGALPEVYAECDVALFPSEWEEPWGLVNLEVLGSGRPLVTTARGGTAEYLEDGRNCLIFAPGHAQGLADAVRRLAGDRELLHRLVDEGVRTAAQFTREKFDRGVLEHCRAAHEAGPAVSARR
jgi:glycogen synthase